MIDNYLILIEKLKHGKGVYRCKCGTIVTRYRHDVEHRNTKSCGCLRKETRESRSIEKYNKIVGNKYNKLIVLEYAGKDINGALLYKIECECGRVYNSSKSNFINQLSCGCDNRYNLKIGDMFYNYKVISILGGSRCKVSCSICQRSITVFNKLIANHNEEKCTCLRKKENSINTQDKGMYKYYMLSTNSMRQKGKLNELTFNEFKELSESNCFYCGSSPIEYSSYKILRNGIDRIDSNFGYSIKNCVPCCYKCNVAKSDMKIEEFFDMIKRIYEHSINKPEHDTRKK